MNITTKSTQVIKTEQVTESKFRIKLDAFDAEFQRIAELALKQKAERWLTNNLADVKKFVGSVIECRRVDKSKATKLETSRDIAFFESSRSDPREYAWELVSAIVKVVAEKTGEHYAETMLKNNLNLAPWGLFEVVDPESLLEKFNRGDFGPEEPPAAPGSLAAFNQEFAAKERVANAERRAKADAERNTPPPLSVVGRENMELKRSLGMRI